MSNYDVSYIFKVFDKFSPAMKEMKKALGDMEDGLDKVQKKMSSANEKCSRFGEVAKKTGKYLTLGLTTPIIGLGTYAVKSAMNFEQMTLSIQAFTGSAEKAAKIMNVVKAESIITPIAQESLANSARLLLSYGTSADNVAKKLHQFSIMSMGSGIDIDTLTRKMGRFELKGYADARMLAMLSSQGLPLTQTIKQMAKAAGMSDAAITKMLGSGKIGWNIIQQAMDRMTKKGSAFYDTAIAKSSTLDARMTEMHSAIRIVAASFGDAILNVIGLNGDVAQVQDKLDAMTKMLPAWIETHGAWIKMGVAALAIGAALGPILWIGGNILTLLSGIAKVTRVIALWTIALEAPWILIGIAIAALVVGFIALYRHSGKFRECVAVIVEGFKEWWDMTMKIANTIMKIISWLFKKQTVKVAVAADTSQLQSQLAGVQSWKAPGQYGLSSMFPSSMQHNINSTLDVNLNAPPGTIKSARSSGDSSVKFNLGRNMAFAR